MSEPRNALLAVGMLLVLAGGCGGPAPSGSRAPDASSGPGQSASSAPTGSEPLSAANLKYRLIDQLGWPWFCDPDEYPVGRGNADAIAIERFPDVQADTGAFAAIVGRYRLKPDPGGWSLKAKMAIYHDWKILNAIVLQPVAGDSARFDYLQVPTQPNGAQGSRTAGTIDRAGAITIEQEAPSGEPICPICLARGARIDTADGSRAVEDLRVGDVVWTGTDDGDRVLAPLLAIGSVRAPADHHVVNLLLTDGRELWVSPGHRLADGRLVGELRPGDRVDDAAIVAAELVPYHGGSTFDILPLGPTGTYWANGILLRSTLRP